MQPKQHSLRKIESALNIDKNFRILDLGCGESKNFIYLLEKYPEMYYIGIEPQKNEADKAARNLEKYKNARVYNTLAYEKIDDWGNFDLCISLSVLEHVKQLEKFLINSISSVKSGGHIIHRYDLGHALYARTLKEKFHVFLGNNFPQILPETKFVTYLDEKKVCQIMNDNGAAVKEVSYHQMPNHKHFLKLFNDNTEEKTSLAEELLDWEDKITKFLPEFDQRQRELLFPAITIWAEKK
jgi:cyclopropane fatty-acyl-phospholipid synthase-like methyltransferase